MADMELNIKNPELLILDTPRGKAAGGSQLWYTDRWSVLSGCGPTAAANLVWYLSRRDPSLGALTGVLTYSLESYRSLQDEMFTRFKPGMGGVNSSKLFTGGLLKYAGLRGIALETRELDIPAIGRPSAGAMADFVREGLVSDCPVAFLNLSNGDQAALDSWHWVTVIGLSGRTAHILDMGRPVEVDLLRWHASSVLGGAFVYVKTQNGQ
jgi:hypothetical protein